MNRDPYFNPPANIDFTPEDPERGLAIGVSRGGPPPNADRTDAPSGLTVNIDPYHDQLGRFTTGPGHEGRGMTTSPRLSSRRMNYTDVTEIPSTIPTSPFGTPAKTPSPASTPTPNPNEPYPTPPSTPVRTPASTPSPTPASAPSATPTATPASTPLGTSRKSPSDNGKSAIQRVLESFKLDTREYDTDQAIPGAIIVTHYGPSTRVHGWDLVHDKLTDKGLGNRGNKLNRLSLAISDDLAHASGLVRGGPVYPNGQYIGHYDDKPKGDGRLDIYDRENLPHKQNWGGVLWGGKLSSKP